MSLERTVMRALKWPTFLSSLFVLYWSVPIASLSYHIRFLDIWSEKRGDVFGWWVATVRTGRGQGPGGAAPAQGPSQAGLALLPPAQARASHIPCTRRSLGMKRVFGTKVYKVGTRNLYRKDCIYLVGRDTRDWACWSPLGGGPLGLGLLIAWPLTHLFPSKIIGSWSPGLSPASAQTRDPAAD